MNESEKLPGTGTARRAPTPIFTPGETMPMHEFERRFRDGVCGGIEPAWSQTRVRVVGVGATLKIEIFPEVGAAREPPVFPA